MLDRKELIFLTGKVRGYNEFRGNSFARSLRVLSIRFVIRFLIAPRDTERERERELSSFLSTQPRLPSLPRATRLSTRFQKSNSLCSQLFHGAENVSSPAIFDAASRPFPVKSNSGIIARKNTERVHAHNLFTM